MSGPRRGCGRRLWIAFITNLTAYPFTNGLLPYIAREIYDSNQTILGYLSAAFAIGSLIGSVTLSVVGNVRVARAHDRDDRDVVSHLAAICAHAERSRPRCAA